MRLSGWRKTTCRLATGSRGGRHGWFRYPNSNPEVFRLAQVAIAAGVKTWEVALLLDDSYRSKSPAACAGATDAGTALWRQTRAAR